MSNGWYLGIQVFCPEKCQDEIWDFVSSIINMRIVDKVDCFGTCLLPDIVSQSYQEIREKYEAWKKRNEVKEMTIEEVSEALGYKVKIVSKEDK